MNAASPPRLLDLQQLMREAKAWAYPRGELSFVLGARLGRESPDLSAHPIIDGEVLLQELQDRKRGLWDPVIPLEHLADLLCELRVSALEPPVVAVRIGEVIHLGLYHMNHLGQLAQGVTMHEQVGGKLLAAEVSAKPDVEIRHGLTDGMVDRARLQLWETAVRLGNLLAVEGGIPPDDPGTCVAGGLKLLLIEDGELAIDPVLKQDLVPGI